LPLLPVPRLLASCGRSPLQACSPQAIAAGNDNAYESSTLVEVKRTTAMGQGERTQVRHTFIVRTLLPDRAAASSSFKHHWLLSVILH
jgi:hypothetical protein